MLTTLSVYVISLSLDALLRSVLGMIGITPLLYIRDILMILAVVFCVIKKSTYKTILILLVIEFYSLVGVYYTDNLTEVFWGVKTILPFIYGVYAYEFIKNNERFVTKLFLITVLLSCLGIGLNYFIEDPFWQHIEGTEVLGATTEGVRNWWIYIAGEKFRRLSGFTRLAGTTAIILLLSSSWLFAYHKRKYLLLIFTFPFILLTTIKVSIGVYIVCIIMMLAYKFLSKEKCLFLFKFIIAFFAFLGLFLPIISLVLGTYTSVLDTEMLRLIFASTEDRMLNSWPGSLGLVFNYGNMLLGRGIGGLGYGVSLFDEKVHDITPIDNFFVFLYGNIGILLIIFISYILYRIYKLKELTEENMFILFATTVFMGEAIMGDMADQFSMMFLGFIVRSLILKAFEVKST